MQLVEEVTAQWKNTRDGLIAEVKLIPEDKLSFRPTPESRTIEELLRHIVTAERVLIRETCRPEANLARRPFPEHIAEHAPHVADVHGKDALLNLLLESQKESMQVIKDYGDRCLTETTRAFDGRTVTKISFLSFVMSHEMYHRGQVAMNVRMLGIEPNLTRLFNKRQQ